jgi:hypothetical protein
MLMTYLCTRTTNEHAKNLNYVLNKLKKANFLQIVKNKFAHEEMC